MKTFLVQVYTYGTFTGEAGYRNGPYLIHAETRERAAKYAVRECILGGKLGKESGYSGKVVLRFIKSKWLESEEGGICPSLLEPYGRGFAFKWNPKKDKIILDEV